MSDKLYELMDWPESEKYSNLACLDNLKYDYQLIDTEIGRAHV